MRLQTATWPDIEAYLEHSDAVIVPIGSTEQHGPNGMLGTDAICPETIAFGVAESMQVLVAPTLSIGQAHHHLGFPGTIALRPSTLLAVLVDVVRSLYRHGFRHVYFLNGHGGNVATVNTAFQEIYAQSTFGDANLSDLCLRLYNWYMSPAVGKLSKELFGDQEGSHATPSEISLTFYAYPDDVKSTPMSPTLAPTGSIRDADDYRTQFADGRIGSNPALATVEAGARLFEASVNDVLEDFRGFIST
ncbi:MAG: creatininase family protein [Gammaproteobacteria bacterium]|nr:creatininase family protein [Gammaproteobacteria bacterium]